MDNPRENTPSFRRYDIDSIRVIALCLLIVYHILIGFQPWGPYIFFVTNEETLQWLEFPIALMNIWRIPILFVVSGMGVYFALERRNLGELLGDRILRILVPLISGSILVAPLSFLVYFTYYNKPLEYWPGPSHLWFLVNIFIYVLLLLPVFWYFKRNPENKFSSMILAVIKKPLGILGVFAVPVVAEALIVSPKEYASFAMDGLHGLTIGLICFFCGFFFVSFKDDFWDAVKRVKLVAFGSALVLYVLRIIEIPGPELRVVSTSIESMCWMLSAFGFGATYLNRRSKQLEYLSSAVYPVYIIHLPIQMFCSTLIFPLALPALLKLILVVFTTFGGSFLLFEIVKRLKWVRLLFGMKA